MTRGACCRGNPVNPNAGFCGDRRDTLARMLEVAGVIVGLVGGWFLLRAIATACNELAEAILRR